MAGKLQWGILATGVIARELADGVLGSSTGSLLAVGSRTQAKADKFGDELNIPRRYGSYEALLADPDVQAVYVATPHPMHAEWAIKAAEAGKHLLVEKPIGINAYEAMAIIDAARANDVFLMEAFMYRCHPQIAKLVELITSGAIGEVRMIQASFGYHLKAGPEHRAFAQELAGGGILDVGCYPVSAARLIAGAAVGADGVRPGHTPCAPTSSFPFAEPLEVKACGHLGETGTDVWTAATLKFPGGIVAQVATATLVNMDGENVIRIFGSDGRITVPDPWTPGRWHRGPTKIIVQNYKDNQSREIMVDAPLDLYTYEADMVGANIEHRQAPAMRWDDTLGNMRVLDRWRQEVGLVYDLEKPKNVIHTITHRPLVFGRQASGNRLQERQDRTLKPEARGLKPAAMKYGSVPGLDKPVSRLFMGADSNSTMPDTAILFDAWFEHGGNAFDTSHGYGNPLGACERNLGQWIRNRGIRDQVVVMEKGANYPNDNPNGLTKELIEGLELLQMDRVDIYAIHRDNPEIPIGEWVDVLNENLSAGRMKVFALSNFTIPRLDAFRECAARRGLQSFVAVSNQFSLAQVQAPIWDCYLVSSSDAQS
ncbi:MAG TPA: aldo/keto reductase, partial [Planctomycetota bacterium]|nr:aldo/keto reductase [Planctomycetota bacterium]